jgi:hypothetical protein
MASRSSDLNPVGASLAVLGALAAIVAIFLPFADPPGALPVEQNSLIQFDGSGQGVAIRQVVLAVVILALTYRYYRQGYGSWGILIPSGILVVGAFIDAGNEDLFALTPNGALGEFLGRSTIQAEPGIAFYVAGVGGALAFLGGLLMWRTSEQRDFKEAHPHTKVCPDCAERVQAAANVCRYCGYRFGAQEGSATPV